MKGAPRVLAGLGRSLLLAACGSSPQAVQPGQSSAVASQSSSVVAPLNEPITVRVTDLADNPISNAVVRAVGTSVTAESDSAGHAYLMGLSPGDYKVRVDANGYYSDVTETSPGRDVHFRLGWAAPIGVFTFKDSAYLIWVVLTVHQDLSLEAAQIWWDCGDRQWHQVPGDRTTTTSDLHAETFVFYPYPGSRDNTGPISRSPVRVSSAR